MAQEFDSIADFLLELDQLKTVNRRTYIQHGLRLENSAEHSWHLAMACWAFAEMLPERYDQDKLLKLALVHDLGEIDGGDTFLYAEARFSAPTQEQQCIERLSAHPGNSIKQITDLWVEQELGESREAKLLKVVDRLLPFLHNLANEGRTWREHHIHQSQVLQKHQFIKTDYPEIFQWFLEKLEHATQQGWLSE